MPGRKPASAALRVLLFNGPEIWWQIFKHIYGTRILLKLRLTCSAWAHQMLYLHKKQFVMFHKAGSHLYGESIFPLITYLRQEWTKPAILLHILPRNEVARGTRLPRSSPYDKRMLPRYFDKRLKKPTSKQQAKKQQH